LCGAVFLPEPDGALCSYENLNVVCLYSTDEALEDAKNILKTSPEISGRLLTLEQLRATARQRTVLHHLAMDDSE